MIYKYYKYKNIEDFLLDKKKSSTPEPYSVILRCGGLEKENDVYKYTPNCFGCLFCTFCDNSLRTKFNQNFNNKINLIADNLFKSATVAPLQSINTLRNKYTNLEKFTGIKETENIQPWATGILNSSSSKQCRVSKEINVCNENYLRDGRLDITALVNNYLLVLEAKISLEDALKVERFIEQFIKYKSEVNKACTNNNIDYNLLLLIGGKETDILPHSHPNCTGTAGDLSKRFYDILLTNKINFISANALWGLALKYYLGNKDYSWDLIIPKIFSDENNYGLLTNGIIRYEKNSFSIVPV